MARPSSDRRETGAEISSISRVSSTFYVEARKHLYEMLSNADDSIEFLGQQVPKPLGRILSFSDYSSSPLCSPRVDREHGPLTSQLRFSPNENARKTSDGICSPMQLFGNLVVDQPIQSVDIELNLSNASHESRVQALDTNPSLSSGPVDEKVGNTSSVIEDEAIVRGKFEVQKEIDTLDAPPRKCCCSVEENSDFVSDDSEGHRQPESLNQDKFEDNQLSSPSRTSTITKVEDIESTSDASGRPSPISVLEPTFMEDDISPKYNKREPVESPPQPLQIKFEEFECCFEDQDMGRRPQIEQNKLMLDYVNAILLASNLSWNQIWKNCLTCDHILDPCLCDRILFFPDQLRLDRELLFDCTNEILMEVCWRKIGVSPWVSFVKPSSKPVTDLQRLVLEVWEQVCWYLLPLPLPHTLDQIVRKDMARSGAWGDRRFDVEDVGVEMTDAILVELIEETLVCWMTENLESSTASSQFEVMKIIPAPTCEENAALTDSCPEQKLVANPTEADKASP